ncbi:MAG: S-layer homology domain-containing protein, partial [Oscillospiraceae bacterium]|nr:S-layer homology domain-containing protein [Oscillospiraceae bacterium]
IANAADFSDNADIDYSEAVDVMVAAGIIDGVGNNSFDPNGTLTREQAAKLITYMLMGENSDKLGVEGSSFNDVAATRWSAPAIEYCAAMGIIDGAGDGNFYPAGKLTGYAFAKMLLTAIGYKSDREGFTGGSWTINVATKALSEDVRLDAGLEKMFGNAELSRQEAAQMALNAIKAPLVEYDNDNTISVNGATVQINGGGAKFVTTTIAKQQNISDRTLTNAGINNTNTGYLVEFGERYLPNLRLVTDDDDFDRPSHTWIYKSEEIGTYVDYENLVETFTVGVTGKDLYDTLGSSTIKEYDVYYFVDGEAKDDIKASNMIRTNTKEYETTGKGVLTQVFVDHDKKAITITSIHTYLAQAQSDYNEKKGTLSLKVFKDDANGTAKTVDVEEVPGIENYKKDDYVLVNWAEIGSKSGTYGKFEVVKIANPEISEDRKLTKYSEENYIVSDGTQYDYGMDGVQKNDLGEYTNDLLKNHTYSLYFDQYGYLAGVVEFSGAKNYLFLAAYDGTGSHMGIKTFPGAAVFLDGTMEEIQIDVTETNKNLTKDGSGDADGNGGAGSNANVIDINNYPLLDDGDNQYNRWFTYTTTTKNNNTIYTLKPAVEWDGTKVVNFWAEQTAIATEGKINSGSVRVVANNPKNAGSGATAAVNKRAYGNDDSVYLTMEIGKVSDNQNSAAAMIGLTKVIGTYTGVQDVDLKVSDTTDNTLENTPGIIAVFDEDLYIIGAVVVGDDNSSSNSYIYVLSGAKNEWIEGDYTYWEMDAVVDGEIKTVTVKEKYGTIETIVNARVGKSNPGKDGLLKATYDKDGYITGVAAAPTPEADTDEWYTVSDYTHEIEAGANPHDGTGKDYKVYSVEYDKTAATNNHPKAGDFYRTGRTLYNAAALAGTPTAEDAGLTLGSGGSVIVVQNEVSNTGKISRVWESFSDLQSAIDYLADADTFEGYVSAVLNDNGSAKYIVFNGKANVDVTDDDGSGSDGTHVREYPRGTLDVTSTDKLDALDVADAIRAFLNDSRIEDVDYDARAGLATVSYTGNRSVTYNVTVNDQVSSNELEAAELMTKVQEAVEKTKKPYGTITIEGNKMTAESDDRTYLTTPGTGTASQATEDFAEFLRALHESGVDVINYADEDYTWDDDLTHRGSRWSNEDGDTLVSEVVTVLTTFFATASNTEKTITLTVDGNPMNFTIKVPAGS